MRRPDLGRPGFGLTIRMVIALAINLALLCGLAALVVWPLFHGDWEVSLVVLFLLAGGAKLESTKAARSRRARAPRIQDVRRVEEIVTRLCATASLPAPRVEIQRAPAPLSWTTAVPWKPPTVHVTTGMLDRLDNARLEAAVAHEIGHIANRDAVLMTLIAWPATALWTFLREMRADAREKNPRNPLAIMWFGIAVAFLGPLAVLFTLAGRVVARHRELAADRAAAQLTRSPARVGAALLAVAEGMERIPGRDLRLVAARDPFHFVPVREARGIRRLWATHPTAEARLRHLQALEATLQEVPAAAS